MYSWPSVLWLPHPCGFSQLWYYAILNKGLKHLQNLFPVQVLKPTPCVYQGWLSLINLLLHSTLWMNEWFETESITSKATVRSYVSYNFSFFSLRIPDSLFMTCIPISLLSIRNSNVSIIFFLSFIRKSYKYGQPNFCFQILNTWFYMFPGTCVSYFWRPQVWKIFQTWVWFSL